MSENQRPIVTLEDLRKAARSLPFEEYERLVEQYRFDLLHRRRIGWTMPDEGVKTGG